MPYTEPNSLDAVRKLLRLPARFNPEDQTSQSLDAAQGFGDFEPSALELQQGQRVATVTTPTGSFATPSQESVRDSAMSKVKRFLNLDTREHVQAMAEEQLKQEGLNKRAEMQSQDGARPYFTPLQTAEGIQSFDTRTGRVAGRLGDFKPGDAAQEALTTGQGVQADIAKVKQFFRPEFVGPLAGRYGTVEQALLGGNPDMTNLYQTAQRLHNTIVYLRTGKQMNESEASRILAEIPQRNDKPDVFMTKLNNMADHFDLWMQNRSKAAYGRTTTEDVNRLTGAPTAPVAPAGGAPRVRRWNPATGRLE